MDADFAQYIVILFLIGCVWVSMNNLNKIRAAQDYLKQQHRAEVDALKRERAVMLENLTEARQNAVLLQEQAHVNISNWAKFTLAECSRERWVVREIISETEYTNSTFQNIQTALRFLTLRATCPAKYVRDDYDLVTKGSAASDEPKPAPVLKDESLRKRRESL